MKEIIIENPIQLLIKIGFSFQINIKVFSIFFELVFFWDIFVKPFIKSLQDFYLWINYTLFKKILQYLKGIF